MFKEVDIKAVNEFNLIADFDIYILLKKNCYLMDITKEPHFPCSFYKAPFVKSKNPSF